MTRNQFPQASEQKTSSAVSSLLPQKMALITVCLGYFIVVIDATVVNVALPSIASDLGSSMAGLQWIIDGYTLMLACLLLSAGSISDQMNPKAIFLGAVNGFLLMSLGCAVARTLLILISFRILQGIAAAFIVPTSLGLINATYEHQAHRSKAVGVWGCVGGIAAALGPVLGGILTAFLGWRAVFWINVPIGLVTVLMGIRYIHCQSIQRPWSLRLDGWGQLTSIVGIACLAFGLISAGNDGWLSLTVLLSLVSFLGLLVLFIIIEMRTTHPMLPLEFFRIRQFSLAIVAGLAINFSFHGVLFLIPLYFESFEHYPILITGLATLPLSSLVAVASYWSGKITSRQGTKWPIVIGLLIGAAGCFALALAAIFRLSYEWLIPAMMAIGFGIAFTMPAATVATMSAVPQDRAGLAAGTFNMYRQIGRLVGIAILGTIAATAINFVDGLFIALVIAGMVYLGAGVLVWIGLARVSCSAKI